MALLNTEIGPERVQVFDQPLGTVQVPGASTSNAAFLISTTLSGAPENTATKVQNLDEFVETFGGPDDTEQYYAVKGYYDNVGTGAVAYIVNVGTSPTANSYIGSASAGTGLRALDEIDDVGMIAVPGLPLAMAYLVQPALIDYTETIRAEFGATLSTSFSLLAVPKEIIKADTDEAVVTAQYLSTTGAGPYVLHVQDLATAVAATGTYTVVDYTQLAGETVTVAGHVLTEGVEWTASVSNASTATSLAAAITALTEVNATALGAVVTVTAANKGTSGNSIATLTSDAVNLTVSGATLSGGTAGAADLSEVTAGMIVTNSGLTFTGVISAVSDGADTITIITNPGSNFLLDGDVLVKKPSAVTYKETVINNPSRVAAWYFNSLVVSDASSAADPGDVLTVDPVGHVAGIIARIDANRQVGGHSHAPAGMRLAGISGIVGLQLALSERKDGGPLRLAFINRITSFPGSGNIVDGGYTADSGESPLYTADEQLIQVMRTLQYIKASLEPGLRSFIWENFSPTTMSQVSNAILSFLRNNSHLFPAGLPEAQQFKVIPIQPSQDELDKGLLRVRVQVRPNKAVRFIEVALEFPLPSA